MYNQGIKIHLRVGFKTPTFKVYEIFFPSNKHFQDRSFFYSRKIIDNFNFFVELNKCDSSNPNVF